MCRRCLYHDIMDMEFMVKKEALCFLLFLSLLVFFLLFVEFSSDGRHREENGRSPEADLREGMGGATVGKYRCRTLS